SPLAFRDIEVEIVHPCQAALIGSGGRRRLERNVFFEGLIVRLHDVCLGGVDFDFLTLALAPALDLLPARQGAREHAVELVEWAESKIACPAARSRRSGSGREFLQIPIHHLAKDDALYIRTSHGPSQPEGKHYVAERSD